MVYVATTDASLPDVQFGLDESATGGGMSGRGGVSDPDR